MHGAVAYKRNIGRKAGHYVAAVPFCRRGVLAQKHAGKNIAFKVHFGSALTYRLDY